MAKPKRRWRTAAATLLVLVPVVVAVVHFSFQVSEYECEVCIAFEGREVCRTVTGETEAEGVRAGTDNACAQLAAGVTDTLRCTRTLPTRVECRRLVDEPSARPTLGSF